MFLASKMAARAFSRYCKAQWSTRVDYVQLDNFSSVALYDNSVPRRKKGKIYEVERIISRKKEKQVSVIVIFDKFTWNIYLT